MVLYDAVNKAVIDSNQKSYSTTFFFVEALKNSRYDEASSLLLTDPSNVGSPFMPSSASPLLSMASFDGETSPWLDKVAYVGAFNDKDNWLNGWTNFDPQNAKTTREGDSMRLNASHYPRTYIRMKESLTLCPTIH